MEYFGRCRNLAQPNDNLLPKVYALMTRGHHQLGNKEEALATCRLGLAAHPQEAELLFWEAILLQERGDLPGAEQAILRLLQVPKGMSFTSADSGLQGYRARQFLAEIYRDQGKFAEAGAQATAVLAECPGHVSALKILSEAQVRQGQWPQLEQTLNALAQHPEETGNVTLFLARAHLARKEFSQARPLLEALIAKVPSAVGPKVVLSHVLLQEGKDWAAAERVLQDILALDPNHTEAQHNLRILLRQQAEINGGPLDSTSSSGGRKQRISRISLCMMVKNEEHNLPVCLQSVADLVDEIIVIDTGSTDRTKEVAEKFGAKAHAFPWVDSFAAARNESIRHATGEWIFWMDADDVVDNENCGKLRALFAGLQDDNAGYVMKCLCLPDPVTQMATSVDHLRLYRNIPGLSWKYRVHEQILPALRQVKADVRWSDVVIHHTGYLDTQVREKKLARDLRLLSLDQTENPNNPFILFNLGCVFQEQNRLGEALLKLRRSLELSHPTDSIVRKLYALIGQCHNNLGQSQEALAACRQGRSYYPDDVEILFQEGMAYRRLGDVPTAIGRWEEVLRIPPGAHFASINTGIRGYLTRQNLAHAYQDLGKFTEAEYQWRKILEERPGYEPALLGLGELFLACKRWPDLEEAARLLEPFPGGKLKATLFRGRAMLARKDFDLARSVFSKMSAEFPEVLEPKVFLSYVYLQEGKDWDAAEKSLTAILTLDPSHEEARRNLTVLYRQLGKSATLPPLPPPTLAELYQKACATPSAMNEHLPTLVALARDCRHITEMGAGLSTIALLFAQPETLVSFDKVNDPQLDLLLSLAGKTTFTFRQEDVLQVDIDATDLLLLDTCRVYDHLREALRRHAQKARRFIVIPGSTAYAQYGETPGHRGIWPAVEEFLQQGTFRLKERYHQQNGLTVLERL